MKKIYLFSLIVSMLVFSYADLCAQQIAFPGAEGMGKFTKGGRGSSLYAPTVYEVTTLDDNAVSSIIPGTLRYAVNKTGPTSRIIVFRVSGTIHLYNTLSINKEYTTIAGQTAPGGGICLADYPVSISADNLIIRFMRFRLGDKNQNLGKVNGSGDGDAFSGTGHKNVIIDHCTMSWSDDESFTVYDGDSTTLQWNMISEPLNYSYHFETGDADYEHHGYGGIWGGKHTSAHHNLIASVKGRACRFNGSRTMGDGSTTGLENVDFRNNVIYNWQDYNTNGGEGGNYNVVNNYYKYGPSTGGNKYMVINPGFISGTLPYGKYYLSGNYVDGSVSNTNDNWLGASMSGGTQADTAQAKVTSAFSFIPIPVQTAADAYTAVMKSAGCILPVRDTLDQRIIRDVMNRTGRLIDVQGGYPHGTAYATTVNAWPTLATGTAQTDSDHDGMPDSWETARGLNPADATDRNGYITANGYNNIENYINGDTIVAVGKVNTCIASKNIVSTNSGNWLASNDSTFSYYLSSSYTCSMDSNQSVVSIKDNAAFGTFTVSYYTTNTIRYDANNHPYLNRNFVIKPLSAIGSSVTVRVYFSVAEYNALKAVDNNIVTLADLRVLQVDDPNYACNTTMTSYPTVIVPSTYGAYGTYQNGYYLEFAVSSFSNFFIGSAKLFPVPVKLTSFDAAVFSNEKVKLNWSTQNEINLNNFVIEKSIDGITFTALQSVSAVNNAVNNYTTIDADPYQGVTYYRLKMFDISGAFTYSKIIAVNVRTVGTVKINPNPVKDFVRIDLPKSTSEGTLKIMALDGRKVFQIPVRANTTSLSLDISSLPKGFYMLISSNDNNTKAIKFIKQ